MKPVPQKSASQEYVAIVDDDPAVLDSLHFLLETAGYRASTYASATTFLDEGAFGPKCLVLDQHMPGMTGLELTEHLRSRGNLIPTLLITGAPSPGILAKASQLGIEKVLEKPPMEDDLISFIGLYIR